jgi:hypothetical protein
MRFKNFYQAGYFERREPSIVFEVMPNALKKLQNDQFEDDNPIWLNVDFIGRKCAQ